MKLKFILLILACFIACDNETAKRKIKLSDENENSIVPQQITTTIRLEPTERRAIAVMFFQNLTGDDNLEWLRKGLAEMFIRALSQSRSISVLSTDRLFEILARLDQADTPEAIDLDIAALVAREANVEAVLTGNITKSGDSLIINVKLHETSQGLILREESVEGPGLEKIFSMVDDLTQKIKDDLRLKFDKSEPARGIAELSTNFLDAWRYYTAGKEFWNKLMFAKARESFEKAIEIDSNFIAASIDLCTGYLNQGENVKASRIFHKLQTIKDKASQHELYKIDLLETRFTHDVEANIAINLKRVQRYPGDRTANMSLGDLYMHLHNVHQAIHYFKKALEIDPGYKLAYNQLGYCYAFNGDFENAIAILNKYKEIAPDEPNPYDSMGDIYSFMGEHEQAEKKFRQALKVDKSFTASFVNLANVYIDIGKYRDALETYKAYLKLEHRNISDSHAYANLAHLYRRFGEKEKSISSYKKALENNNSNFTAITLLHEIYLENNDTTKARQLIEDSYDKIKKLLERKASRENALMNLGRLSLLYDININETINILKEATSNAGNKISEIHAKFSLTLLYNKRNQLDEVNELWQDVLPSAFMNIFKHVHSISYGSFWKYYFMLNQFNYKFMVQAIQNYDTLILFAMDNKIKSVEMIYRIFIADLYFHAGNLENAIRQLKIAGMPTEETWMVIGPFDNKNGFHKKYPPEKKIQLQKMYADKSRSINWQHADDGKRDGFINLRQIYNGENWSVAYGVIYVKSPEKKEVQLRVGTNEAVKIWLNNEEVWRFNAVRGAIFDNNSINVTLKKGHNKILIKVCNRVREWGFYFRITDEAGNGLPDIEFVSADSQT